MSKDEAFIDDAGVNELTYVLQSKHVSSQTDALQLCVFGETLTYSCDCLLAQAAVVHTQMLQVSVYAQQLLQVSTEPKVSIVHYYPLIQV